MYISELEKRSGVSARAIRLYESLGLLSVARRGSYRTFTDEHVEFVQLIKRAQSLGVTLAELQSLRAGDNDLDWAALNKLLLEKKHSVIQQQQQLQQQLDDIEHYQEVIADCVERGIDRCAT
jgi:DNA-binding transcriptional MerR regulator